MNGQRFAAWTDVVLALREVWGRAPSAHNTQPWLLRADGDRLLLHWDPARELVVADPTRRDLWLSLGALAEALVIAAADAGHDLEVAWDVDARTNRAAVVRRRGPARDTPDPPARFTSADLFARSCARGPYAAPFVAADEVARTATDAGGSPAGVTGLPVADRPGLAVLPAALVNRLLPRADRWIYSAPAQVAELRRWLRLWPGHPAYDQDGLSDQALALSRSQARALRIALSPRVWPQLSRAGGPALLAAAGRQRDLGTVVAWHVPVALAADPAAVAEAGRGLLRVWLVASRRRLHVHPLSQLIDAPATAKRVHAALPGDRRALSAFRIGTPEQPPARSARHNPV